MNIRYVYTGRRDAARFPITVKIGNNDYILSNNDMSIEVPDGADSFILKESWIITKLYMLPQNDKHITILWNTSGSLLLAVLQMFLFKASSFYFTVSINNEQKIAQWHKRKNKIHKYHCSFFFHLPVRFFIECSIFVLCCWCGVWLAHILRSV